MLVLLSPAKSLDYSTLLPIKKHTQPRMLEDSALLVERLRAMGVNDLMKLMGISENLAQLNVERFSMWEKDFTPQNSRQALFAFTGDVYQGINLDAWRSVDFKLAQKRLRILSGLYGVLRPLDLMQPYRLEMGTKLDHARGKNLYEFWGEKITRMINDDLPASGSQWVVNLASNEYFSAIKKKLLTGSLITPVFKDEKGGKYKVISFFAKKARGMMADFIIREAINKPEDMKRFNEAGYQYSEQQSDASQMVFLRKEQ